MNCVQDLSRTFRKILSVTRNAFLALSIRGLLKAMDLRTLCLIFFKFDNLRLRGEHDKQFS
jgi:hypothetical protein